MSRTLQQLRDDGQFSELTRTLRGQVPGVPNPSTAAVARRFGITESAVEAVRVALTTPAPKVKAPAPTRIVAETARERFVHESAEIIRQRANAAEERGLERASLQELAAVAALAVPR